MAELTVRSFELYFGEKSPQFVEWLQSSGALVAGGFVCNVVANITPENLSDLDIYINVANQARVWDLVSVLGLNIMSSNVQPSYDSSFLRRNGIGLHLRFEGMPLPPTSEYPYLRTTEIDVMVTSKPVLEVVSNFDLTCAQCWYDGRAIGGTHLEETRARRAYLNPEYTEPYVDENPFTRKRVAKYMKRGFTITLPAFVPRVRMTTVDVNTYARDGTQTVHPEWKRYIGSNEEFVTKAVVEAWIHLEDLEGPADIDLAYTQLQSRLAVPPQFLSEGDSYGREIFIRTAREVFAMADNYTLAHFQGSTGLTPDQIVRLIRYRYSWLKEESPFRRVFEMVCAQYGISLGGAGHKKTRAELRAEYEEQRSQRGETSRVRAVALPGGRRRPSVDDGMDEDDDSDSDEPVRRPVTKRYTRSPVAVPSPDQPVVQRKYRRTGTASRRAPSVSRSSPQRSSPRRSPSESLTASPPPSHPRLPIPSGYSSSGIPLSPPRRLPIPPSPQARAVMDLPLPTMDDDEADI